MIIKEELTTEYTELHGGIKIIVSKLRVLRDLRGENSSLIGQSRVRDGKHGGEGE
ncbi:MAG: hypothetical protein LBB89_12035 [Treponema sp.]|jgi:hypothetical protein|nr:hypothetical protein [Treponema sp.]